MWWKIAPALLAGLMLTSCTGAGYYSGVYDGYGYTGDAYAYYNPYSGAYSSPGYGYGYSYGYAPSFSFSYSGSYGNRSGYRGGYRGRR